MSPQACMEQAEELNHQGQSIRRACGLIGVARSHWHYVHRQPVKDAPVIEQMRRLARRYPRYGYRRIRVFLARESQQISADRAERLWSKSKLQLPRKRPRRKPAESTTRSLTPTGANRVWAYDFVFDAYANGQSLKRPTIIDEFTRENVAIDAAGSIHQAASSNNWLS